MTGVQTCALPISGGDDDTVVGIASTGAGVAQGIAYGIFIDAAGELLTGAGNDEVVGEVTVAGGDVFAKAIFGDSSRTLSTGTGDDLVDASRGGFGGGFRVDLGDGADTARGFGEVVIDGGDGADSLELDVSLAAFAAAGGEIAVAGGADRSVELTRDGETLEAQNIESFRFDGETFSVAELEVAFDALVA